MATYTRSSAWNKGGTFDNPDLLWYAKGVGAMQARAIRDPASWWFFAAIHGQYLVDQKVPVYLANGWGSLPTPPTVPIGKHFQPRRVKISIAPTVETAYHIDSKCRTTNGRASWRTSRGW
jgi:hypothetical protein